MTVEYVGNGIDTDDINNYSEITLLCQYTLQIDFNIINSLENDVTGESNLNDNCDPNDSTGTSLLGLLWHTHCQNWI